MSSKPTELDANQLLDSSMGVHYKAAAYHLASHQELTPEQAKQMAERAHVGCSGDCAEQGECNCSHSIKWMAPRQPRRPEPRTPTLPMWTRLTLWAQSRMSFAGDWRDLAAVAAILVVMGVAMAAVGALVLLR